MSIAQVEMALDDVDDVASPASTCCWRLRATRGILHTLGDTSLKGRGSSRSFMPALLGLGLPAAFRAVWTRSTYASSGICRRSR